MTSNLSQRHPSWNLYACPAQWYADGIAIALKQMNISAPALIPIEPANFGIYRSPILLAIKDTDREACFPFINNIVQEHLCSILSSHPEIDHPHELLSLGSLDSGWLTFQPHMELQLHCLNQISGQFQPTVTESIASMNANRAEAFQWDLQYAHARCVSLLRMTQEQFEFTSPVTLGVKEFKTGFSLDSPLLKIERELWDQLLCFPLHLQKKGVMTPSFPQRTLPITSIKTAQHLMQITQHWLKLFQNFYSHCPLFCLRDSDQQPLLKLRIVLLSGLQKVLSFLWLHLFAGSPPECV